MADVRMRPRFRRVVACDPDAVLASLADLVERPDSGVDGRRFDSSVLLEADVSRTRFWSPQLHLSVERDAAGGSLVHGIFGPHPTIWSLFVVVYVASGFVGMMGALFAYAQWVLDASPTAFWVVPAATLLAIVTYVVARIGRYLGREQTRFLFDAAQSRLDALGMPHEPQVSEGLRPAPTEFDRIHASHA